MKVKTKKEFFHVLKKSRLLSPEERVSARAASQGISEPEAIARQLMESGRLTRWQAGQLLSGKTRFFLGKYKLLKICGRGGMGVVFKAEQPDVHRTVAIKVLHRSLLSKPRAVSRFKREMRLAATLNHPNLVVAFDADQVRDTHYLVMEYVTGKSLKHYSQKHGPLPILWSCECIRQAALGLAHIHERGLAHRDIKPSNLLVMNEALSRQPRLKILDVGLSRFVSEEEDDDGLTKAGQILGTMDYMAPEQIKDARTADIRADIYSLGATLFQLLTGSPPLAGKTLMQTYISRMTQQPPPASLLRTGVPPELDAVLARMLERDPELRYHAPTEVAADLAAILTNRASEVEGRPDSSRSGESASQVFRFDLSANDDSMELSNSGTYPADTSLSEFLDQLAHDDSASSSLTLVSDTPLLNRFRGGRKFYWQRMLRSARYWLQSLLPQGILDRESNTQAKSPQRTKTPLKSPTRPHRPIDGKRQAERSPEPEELPPIDHTNSSR